MGWPSPFVDLNLEAATLLTSRISQPFLGASLRAFYLAERVRCQLVGEDAPQILVDPSVFMLALLSMTDAEYLLWRNGISYAKHVTNELDYNEFSDTRHMPSLTTVYMFFLFLFISIFPLHCII